MLTANKSKSKLKKLTKTTSNSSKPLKELKVDRNQKSTEGRHTLTIDHLDTQTRRQRIPSAITCPNKEDNLYNPNYDIFDKCQRTVSNAQSKIIKPKEKNKNKVKIKNVAKERKKEKEKEKDLTFSPHNRDIEIQTNRKVLKKKQRTSRSVDNIKRISNKALVCKSHSQSRSPSAKGYKYQPRKDSRTETDQKHKRKASNMSDISLLHKADDEIMKNTIKSKNLTNKSGQTTQKKNIQRSRSKSMRLIAPKSKRKSLERIRIQQQQKCLTQLDKIRTLRQIVQIQKNLRVYLQTSNAQEVLEQDSLVTIKDFSEQHSQSQNIMNLISQIGDHIDDQNIQQKLKKLSNMAQSYFYKKNSDSSTQKRIQSMVEPESIQQNNIQEDEQSSKQIYQNSNFHLMSLNLPHYQQDQQQKIQLPSENISSRSSLKQQVLQTSRPSRQQALSSIHLQTVISPRSCFSQIDRMLNQKNVISHQKYQKKMDLLYKLYQNQLYSPRTFQNKLQFLDSIHMKQYQQFDKQIESANRIKTLIKSMKQDQEQIAQLEAAYKDQKWKQAADLMKIGQQINVQNKYFSSSKQKQLPTSPVNVKNQNKINEIFEIFQKSSSEFIVLEQEQEDQHVLQQSLSKQKYLIPQTKIPLPSDQNILQLSQISVIRQYCADVYKYIVIESPLLFQQFLTNLLSPITYDYDEMLQVYGLDISKANNINPNYFKWINEMNSKKVISEEAIEQLLENLPYNNKPTIHNLIHQRMILEALNQSLDYERAHGLCIQGLCNSQTPKQLKYIQLFKGCLQQDRGYLDQVQDIFVKAVQRLIGWAKHYCGILIQSIPGRSKVREGIPEQQSQCQQQILRQVRMALMLHGSLVQYDQQIKNISSCVIEVKLRLDKIVTNYIIQEVVKDLVFLLEQKI